MTYLTCEEAVFDWITYLCVRDFWQTVFFCFKEKYSTVTSFFRVLALF